MLGPEERDDLVGEFEDVQLMPLDSLMPRPVPTGDGALVPPSPRNAATTSGNNGLVAGTKRLFTVDTSGAVKRRRRAVEVGAAHRPSCAYRLGPWDFDELVGLAKLVEFAERESQQGGGQFVSGSRARARPALDADLAALLVPTRSLKDCERERKSEDFTAHLAAVNRAQMDCTLQRQRLADAAGGDVEGTSAGDEEALAAAKEEEEEESGAEESGAEEEAKVVPLRSSNNNKQVRGDTGEGKGAPPPSPLLLQKQTHVSPAATTTATATAAAAAAAAAAASSSSSPESDKAAAAAAKAARCAALDAALFG